MTNENVRQAAPEKRYLPPQTLANALAHSVKKSISKNAWSYDGRLERWQDALVHHQDEKGFEAIAQAVDVSRLRQPEGGFALSMNSFWRWREEPHKLPLAGEVGFTDLRFDARCPTGVRGTPPHLDLIAARGSRLVAVTGRGSDYLLRGPSRLAQAYRNIKLTPALEPWGALLDKHQADRSRFAHVDPNALIKYALGLGRTFSGYSLKLVYHYVEPRDADRFEAFRRHREELEELRLMVAGSAVSLHPVVAGELWADWESAYPTTKMRAFVAQLRRRYDVAIADELGL